MADRIIERTEVAEPRETVVVHDRDDRVVADRGSNAGVVIAIVIVLLILLMLVFGRGLFSGGGSSGVTPSTTTSTGSSQ